MSDVEISFSDSPRETAVNLLAAASVLDLPSSVVRTTSGGFIVPSEVADKAGYGEDAGEEKKPAKKTSAKKKSASSKSKE